MKVKFNQSVKYKMQQRLETLESPVVLREDFEDLGQYRQISQGLAQFIREKRLVRLGYGIYAKAYSSQYDPDTPLIVGGADGAFREVLNRLQIEWEPGCAEVAYNTGQSTQVPVYNIVKLKTRFRRQIGYAKRKIIFEGSRNAK